MVIIFIIILIIIFLFLYFSSRRNNFQNIIKASELKTDQTFLEQPDSVFIGEELETDNITYDTQFNFKLNNNQYLNNGIGCSIRNTNSSCLNKESKLVSEAVLKVASGSNSEKHINVDSKTADFKFIEADRMNSKYVNYGDPILIQNFGNTKSYLALCLDDPKNIKNYGIISSVYFYNNINDALNNGRWIIIPNYNHKVNDSNYNFYDDYDLQKLRSLSIPVKLTDNFLIVNENKLNGKLVYLNLLGKDDSNYLVNCGELSYKVCVGVSTITDDKINPMRRQEGLQTVTNPVLNNNIIDETIVTSAVRMNLFEWSIEPLKYNINVFDTLLVEGSLKLGYGDGDSDELYEITTDTLRYIKSIPFHFKDKICLKPTDEMINAGDNDLSESSFKCIGKSELEMLNGSRPINIKSTVPSKPFTLYSRPQYQGRSLRIGFDYINRENLPFFGYNRFLNKGDDGKWKSLSIDGNYIAIIFNKPDYGLSGSEKDFTTTFEQIQAEQDAILQGKEVSNTVTESNTSNTSNNNNNNNNAEPEVKGMFEVIRPPGIENVLGLGEEWKDGIKSIQFVTMPVGEAYELKCLEKITFQNDRNKRGDKKNTNNLYTANTCVNGNEEQQFYLTNMYDNLPDKEFTLSKLYDDLDINHLHFHRHKFSESHN